MDWDDSAERFTDPWAAGLLLDELELRCWVAMCLYYGDDFKEWPAGALSPGCRSCPERAPSSGSQQPLTVNSGQSPMPLTCISARRRAA
jgi:hypothetical protein